MGEAELTHEMRAEANETKWNLTMPNEKEMSVAKNRAGKAALSRTEASSKVAERSGVLCLLAVVRGASRQRVERGWLTEIARNGAKRNEGADSLRWKRRAGVCFCRVVKFFCGQGKCRNEWSETC